MISRILLVRVVSARCAECRLAIARDCAALGLPVPQSQDAYISERWLNHVCPHEEDGLELRLITNTDADDDSDARLTALERRNSEIEDEQLPWERNLDAKKSWGYPCREEGRYGSYPSHDGFDDESSA